MGDVRAPENKRRFDDFQARALLCIPQVLCLAWGYNSSVVGVPQVILTWPRHVVIMKAGCPAGGCDIALGRG